MMHIDFESFFRLANIFWKSIGLHIYELSDGKQRSHWMDLVFLISMLNLHFLMLGEVVYVVLALRDNSNFIEATMSLTYIGFIIVGAVKIWNIWNQKQRLTQVMRVLHRLHPNQPQQQATYGVQNRLRNYNLLSLGFALVHQILIWTYNLYAIVSYLIHYYWFQRRETQQSLPYFCYVPWNWRDHWTYYLLYALQNLAGHTCTAGQIACDITLGAVATQVIMHYQQLAKRIGTYVVREGSNSLEFLTEIIEYHQEILHLSDDMNIVFGVSLLTNFISSAVIICVLGFQMSIGGNGATSAGMLFLFLACSLLQTFLISNYAQDLIHASESVGHAAYNHDWHNADIRYRKMLVLFIERAQKPSILKATSLLHISLAQMTTLIQTSYKLFAVLRTIYNK